jgi:hypothetical protein
MTITDYLIVTLTNVFLTFGLITAIELYNKNQADKKEEAGKLNVVETELAEVKLEATLAKVLKPLETKIDNVDTKVDKLGVDVNNNTIAVQALTNSYNGLIGELREAKAIKKTKAIPV